MEKGFNVRVYGWLECEGKVLVSRETFEAGELVKFPGGGVELGEGPSQALRREFLEEVQLNVDVVGPAYTSPNFHRSYFHHRQLLALYFSVQTKEKLKPSACTQKFAGFLKQRQLFWCKVDQFDIETLTHEVDREAFQYYVDHVFRA